MEGENTGNTYMMTLQVEIDNLSRYNGMSLSKRETF